jgi:hypothetical protein
VILVGAFAGVNGPFALPGVFTENVMVSPNG